MVRVVFISQSLWRTVVEGGWGKTLPCNIKYDVQVPCHIKSTQKKLSPGENSELNR